MELAFWDSLFNITTNNILASTAIIQTIILFMVYCFGNKFLEQHRKKYKAENEIKLIESTIKNLSELLILYDKIFTIKYELYMNFKKDKDIHTFKKILNEFWKKADESYSRTAQLQHEININLELINNKKLSNKKLRLLWKSYQDSLMILFARYIFLRGQSIEELLNNKELETDLPFSIYQRTQQTTNDFLKSHDELSKELKAYYVRD